MTQIRKRFTREEKLEIVKQSLEPSASIQSVADRFNISSNAIYTWRRLLFSDGKEISLDKLSSDQQEIKRLKKELREAELERDILKKAVGIFSKKDRKFTNS